MDRVANKMTEYYEKFYEEMLTLSSDSNFSVSLHSIWVVHLSKKFVNLMEGIVFHASLVSELLFNLLQYLHTAEVRNIETRNR